MCTCVSVAVMCTAFCHVDGKVAGCFKSRISLTEIETEVEVEALSLCWDYTRRF